MWYNRPKQYLRKTFSQSGLGVLLMAKKPDNTFEAAQMDANGAIKISGGGGGGSIFDSLGNPILTDDATNGILKVAIHNSGGGNVAVSTSTLQTALNNLITTLNGLVATAANQTTGNSLLTTISSNTASGLLSDISYSVVSTSGNTALTTATSKKITLINPSTNTKPMEVAIGSGGVVLPLEPGYSLIANVSNANRITVKQTGGEAEKMYYIISN